MLSLSQASRSSRPSAVCRRLRREGLSYCQPPYVRIAGLSYPEKEKIKIESCISGAQLRRLYSHLKKQARQIIGGPVFFCIVFMKASYFKENSFIQCYVFYGAFYPWYDKEGKTN